MRAVEKLIEQQAFKFRQHVRAKAGLAPKWNECSQDMFEFYWNKAYEYLVATGEIVVEE